MGRINSKQMSPLYRPKRFQDTIQFNSPFSYSSDKSESIFLPVIKRRNNGTSRNRQWKGYQIQELPVYIPGCILPQKEWKVTSCSRSFSVELIHKDTTIQNGDSQVSIAIDSSQQLCCIHRSDRCLSTCSNLSSFKEVPWGWSGGAKVSCILCHRGVQLILAYSWARPAILVAGNGRDVMFLFLLFLHFHSCSSFFPVPLFHSSAISSVSFLPFSGRRHKMTHKG